MTSHRDRRGVSEVIAFVVIFGIIVSSVALLYMSGFDAMTSMQEHEQMENAERAMGALAANLNDVERDGITERRGELELREGAISVGENGTRMSIAIDGDTDVVEIDGKPFDDKPIGAITYSDGSERIAYEGGGIFRGDRTGNVTVDDPRVVCTENDGETVAIVSLIVVDADVRTVQSTSGVEIEAIEQNSTVVTNTTETTVTITIEESSYENGWTTALDRNGWSGSGDTYECDADRATVRVVSVDVNF